MDDIKQRKIVEYTRKEKLSISRKIQILSLQIEDKSDDGINTIWDNQDKCGEEICNIFNNKSIINCLVYGMTQTGKTGCMTALIHHFTLSNLIPINHIYIITGLSDIAWKKDTKDRMPDSINSRVFHRSQLPKQFITDIRSKKNLLIIMDEIQIACVENQTIYKTFEECGFYNLDNLLDNDIKLIQFSATPDGNISDITDWKDHSAKIKLEPGKGYYGIKEALKQGRVRQFKELSNIDNVRELKTVIEDTYSDPRYHLIRVPNKRHGKQHLVITNFIEVFGSEYKYDVKYLEIKKDDINQLLSVKPAKHTIVFYCEILRCAKTQHKKYIGISYERFLYYSNDSIIIQGSFGRLTGYDDNGDSICYTNISSLERYLKLWDNNMDFKKGIIWNTNTTFYHDDDDITYSKGTFNSVKYIDQLQDNCSNKAKKYTGDPTIQKFYGECGQQEMINWFKNNLKAKMSGRRGPNKKKPISKFYKGSIRNGLEVLSTSQVNKERRWGLKNGIVRSYPCYSDVSDPSTLEWWLIYYE